MSTTKHSQLQIGRLVRFSPSMGDFPIFERRSYFLDLMKKGLSLAADFGILRVDHVLRQGIRINPNPLTLLFRCYLNTCSDAKELDFEYGLVLNCLRERIYPLCLAKPPQAFPCSLIAPSVFILIHSFPGGQHTIEYVLFLIGLRQKFGQDVPPILPLLSLIKLEILASNLHILANPFPFGFLKTLTYLQNSTIYNVDVPPKCARASEKQAYPRC